MLQVLRIKNLVNVKNPNNIYLYAIAVGVLCGLVSMFFSFMLNLLETFYLSLHTQTAEKSENILQKIIFFTHNPSTSLIVLLLPAFGGLAAGLITHFFCKDASGTGTDEMIYAFHYNEGKINPRIPFYKAVATLFTLPTGGSGGKEGPISLIGAGIGVWISNVLKTGARARRTLLLAGTAAGLGSAFRSPLGGALTAAEMVYKHDIESDALIPCFISSVTAYLVYIAYAGTESAFHISAPHAFHANEIVFYLMLGGLCFGFGFLFIKGFKDTRTFFDKVNVPKWLKPAIGGLLTGALAMFFFGVAGTGTDYLNYIIEGHFPDYFPVQGAIAVVLSCLFIAFLKIVASTLTIGSGGSAGIFGPSLFIGAMLGAAVGILAQLVFPNQNVSVASFMVIGMGAFYAGVAQAPVAGIVMIIEMSGNYSLLPPIIIVSVFTFLLSRRISFYKNQVDNRFKSPAHSYNMRTDVLDSTTLKDFFPEFRVIATADKDWNFSALRHHAANTHASDFVLIDKNWNYYGIVSLRNISVKKEDQDKPICMYAEPIPYVTGNESLSKALNIILEHDVDKVAVMEGNICAGYLRYRDIFEAYNSKVKQL